MGKPAFDPNKPFEAVKSDKPAFDPNKPFEAAAPAPAMSTGRALQHGAEQGLTLGFGDEAQGAIEALGQAIGIKGLGAARHLDEWGLQEPNGFDGDKFSKVYADTRDKERTTIHQAQAEHPYAYGAGQIAGGLAVPMGGAKTLGQAMVSGGRLGAAMGLGSSEAKDAPDMVKDTAIGMGYGLGGGALAHGAGTLLNPKGMQQFAEDMAVNATGATGKQASNFAPNAGRELLDRGIVKFGDNQANIADRASGAVKAANNQIDTALSALEARGIKVDANDIYNAVRAKITNLKKDPSQSDVANLLEKELDHLIASADANGSAEYGVKTAEQIKRGFGRKAGNWMDAEKGQAGKEMYRQFRDGVENAAQAADPATADIFREGKSAHRLLAPIQEAAERKAMSQAQSPIAGFGDMMAAGAGHMMHGGLGAIAMPIARRVVGPRMSSSAAVTADQLSQMMMNSPKFSALAQKSPNAFRALANKMAERMGSGEMTPAFASRGELDRDSSTSAQEKSPTQAPIPEEQGRKSFIDGN